MVRYITVHVFKCQNYYHSLNSYIFFQYLFNYIHVLIGAITVSLKFTLPTEYPDISPVIEIPIRNQVLSAKNHRQLMGFIQEKVRMLQYCI